MAASLSAWIHPRLVVSACPRHSTVDPPVLILDMNEFAMLAVNPSSSFVWLVGGLGWIGLYPIESPVHGDCSLAEYLKLTFKTKNQQF